MCVGRQLPNEPNTILKDLRNNRACVNFENQILPVKVW